MGTKDAVEGFFSQASVFITGNEKHTENTVMTLFKVLHPHSDVMLM